MSTAEKQICPKGHVSTESDYCSECGAKLGGSPDRGMDAMGSSASSPGQICPDCGTLREQSDIAFCEVCGYNFVTGAHGEVGILPTSSPVAISSIPEESAQPEPEPPAIPIPQRWLAMVSVDPRLRGPDSPEAPIDVESFTVELDHPVSLIGRKDETRGIFPEIALPLDEAVSRRHALLQKDEERGLLLRDIGAANGTRLNGKEIAAMVDYVVKDGDEIALGHWTCIRIEAQQFI